MLNIRIDDLSGDEIARLLLEHHQEMLTHSPPESVHALDLAALKAPDITFWTAWSGNALAGCGALKALSDEHGEIKSMRTARAHRRTGVAQQILDCILLEAKRRTYSRISLETGSMDAFIPARRLYKQNGFHYRGPFADYVADPNSLFMSREL